MSRHWIDIAGQRPAGSGSNLGWKSIFTSQQGYADHTEPARTPESMPIPAARHVRAPSLCDQRYASIGYASIGYASIGKRMLYELLSQVTSDTSHLHTRHGG